jgi:hypothetical protein
MPGEESNTPISLTWVHPEKARYYQAHLDRDLFGEWTLRKVWGGLQSRRGRLVSTGVGTYAEGVEMIEIIGRRRAQRGYRPMPWIGA